jgi:hypothetical protein
LCLRRSSASGGWMRGRERLFCRGLKPWLSTPSATDSRPQ